MLGVSWERSRLGGWSSRGAGDPEILGSDIPRQNSRGWPALRQCLVSSVTDQEEAVWGSPHN